MLFAINSRSELRTVRHSMKFKNNSRLINSNLLYRSDLIRFNSASLFSRPAVDPKGMIGIKYGINMMEPNYPMAFHEEDDEKYIEKEKDRSTNLAIDSDSSNIDSCSVVTPKVCSGTSSSTNKKASILKSPLLRLTRTKKRSSGAVVKENAEQIPTTNNAIINSSSSGTNGSSSNNNENSSACKDDKTKINDTIIEDNTSACEKEDHIHCHDNDTYNNVSANPIDYDDDDIKVKVNVTDRGKLNISDIESDEEEFKKGLETNRKSDSHIKNKDLPLKSRPLHASTNLSIVVTRNEVVVEYRDKDQEGGGQKQSSPDLQLSVGRDETTTPTNATSKSNSISSASTSTSKRYIVRKGIMKRPRDSNIAYHHPQKPNHPPPGYDVKSLWRKDYTANSTTDREYPHQRLRSQPTKRVSFDEVSLTTQFQLSELRRQTRHKRLGLFDMLAMAIPVLLPYLIAISILLASSLVPLPQSPSSSSSSSQSKVITSSEKEVEILQKPPIIFDLASRMWDERKLHGATKIPDRDETNISSNEDYITGRTGKDNINRQLFDTKKKSITDTQQQISTGSMRNERKNPTDKAVATISVVIEKRNSKTNTCSDSTARKDEGREVATKNQNSTVQKRNPVVRVLSGFMKILARVLFPFHKIQKT
jgi:hypothetical protein